MPVTFPSAEYGCGGLVPTFANCDDGETTIPVSVGLTGVTVTVAAVTDGEPLPVHVGVIVEVLETVTGCPVTTPVLDATVATAGVPEAHVTVPLAGLVDSKVANKVTSLLAGVNVAAGA